MFEETLPSAALPGSDPVAGWPVACLDPCDLVDPELEAMLDRLAREYAAVPAAGVLLVDVDELPAGPELAGPLARLDVSSASAGDLVEATAGLERLEAWAAARKAAVLDELASRAEMRPDLSGYRSVNPVTNTAMVIAGRCHVTCRQAENLVGHALQLVEDFPDAHTALSSGLIDLRRARVITDELGGQDPAVRTRVEAAVLPEAPGLDSVALRKLIRRLLHELAPVEAAERHRAARDARYVAVTPASDGMAHLEARLPAVDAVALNTALNVAAADAKRADTAAGRPVRTKDQRRADALADLAWTALTASADAATAASSVPATDGAAHDACTHDTTTANHEAHDAHTDGTHGTDGTTIAGRGCPAGRPSGFPTRTAVADTADHDARTMHDDGTARAGATTIADRTDHAAYADHAVHDAYADHGCPAGRPHGSPTTRTDVADTTTIAAHAVHADHGSPASRTPGDPPADTTYADRGSPASRTPGDPPADTTYADRGSPAHHADTADAGRLAGAAGTVRTGIGAAADATTRSAARGTGHDTPGRSASTRPRRPISVHVTIPFTTLAGLSDEPGELDGYGPIPAHVARELAAAGVWTWLATDPGTGQLLDHGRTRYRPTKALAAFITARDRTCRAPGCHRPARTADLDHIVPFAAGGTTSAGNLHALCEQHHLLKHHAHWHVERPPDGTTRWTSPTGHRYTRSP